jgi:aminoglycoside phosphotransferase (APT) family kinase protein
VRPVDDQGWDNRTFRLGEDLAARLPSGGPYAVQVEKELAWLPSLAPLLPLPIPIPVALGEPAFGYPWRWSVNTWLSGKPVANTSIGDRVEFARSLGGFLHSLHGIDATDGPAAGAHCFWRGGPLATYDVETRAAIARLGRRIDGDAALGVWEAALAAPWQGPPVWFHGDVAAGNLLARDGRLIAVIDFGCCGVGDPACDLAIAWTFFEGASRAAFREAVVLDEAAWLRGKSWALWKALILMAQAPGTNPRDAAASPEIIAGILRDQD